MDQTILVALTANGRSFAENAKEAGIVTLLGMVAVFVVLALLWGIIEILHRLLSGTEKPSGQTETEKVAPAAPEASAVQPVAQETDDGALIAAITAAISASLAEQGYTGGFRVVSFKRASARRTGRL